MPLASTNPQPLPDEDFPAPDVQPKPQRPRRILHIGLGLGTLLVAAAAWQFWLKPGGPTGPAAPVVTPTAVVDEDSVERVVRLTGVTSSVRSADITAPRMMRRDFQMTLLDLVPSGTMVKPGDVVAKIDNQSLLDRMDSLNDSLETAQANLRKRRANQNLDRTNLQQDIAIAKAQLDRSKLDAGAAEVRTVVDQELLKLSVEEAQKSYEAMVADLQFREASLDSDMRIAELDYAQSERDMQQYSRDLERYTITTPMSGMAVRQEVPRSGELSIIEVGDQIRPGMAFLKIMDLSDMKVQASVNQSESPMLRPGQEVRIGLDAYPELKFTGTVVSVGALATGSASRNDYVRSVPVTIHIDGNHPRLIPDLTAYADVILERHEGAARIPLQAIFEESGQAYVYVKNGDKFDKRPVVLGERNFTHVAVTDGLKPGEEVATERPAAPVS